MAQFEPFKEEIERAGSLVYIAAQKRGGWRLLHSDAELYLQAHPSSFPFLLDEDRSVSKAYGVYVALNLESVNIARAATFLVNSHGRIEWSYVGRNQYDRAPAHEVVARLTALAPGR